MSITFRTSSHFHLNIANTGIGETDVFTDVEVFDGHH